MGQSDCGSFDFFRVFDKGNFLPAGTGMVLDADGKVLADIAPEELPSFFKTIPTTDGHG